MGQAIRTGGVVVVHEEVVGRTVNHEDVVDLGGVGCPRPLPAAKAPFPEADMVKHGWKGGGELADGSDTIRDPKQKQVRAAPRSNLYGYERPPLT